MKENQRLGASWEGNTGSPQDADGEEEDDDNGDDDDDDDGNDKMMTTTTTDGSCCGMMSCSLVMMSKPPTGVLPKKGRSVSYTCSGPGLAWPSRGVGVCWGSVPGPPKGVCPTTASLFMLGGTAHDVDNLGTAVRNTARRCWYCAEDDKAGRRTGGISECQPDRAAGSCTSGSALLT